MTTCTFDEAPETDQKLIIYRCTDLTPLSEFYPGTAIKAQDLNDNFFILAAIEDANYGNAREYQRRNTGTRFPMRNGPDAST